MSRRARGDGYGVAGDLQTLVGGVGQRDLVDGDAGACRAWMSVRVSGRVLVPASAARTCHRPSATAARPRPRPMRFSARTGTEEQGRDGPVIVPGLRPGSLEPEPVEHPEHVSRIEIPAKLGSSRQFPGIRQRLFPQNPAGILVSSRPVQALPDSGQHLSTASHVRLHAPASPVSRLAIRPPQVRDGRQRPGAREPAAQTANTRDCPGWRSGL